NHSFRNDNNNVDIDKEMVEMVKNTLSYNIISEQISKNLKLLQIASSFFRFFQKKTHHHLRMNIN
ncbi:MAG: hypothetical protein WBK73_02050, partial [Tepidanaerobacteraceae bacterium]